MRRLRQLGLLATLVLLGQGLAFAASSATVNIDVTIQANLSVEVDLAVSSTYTATWNASSGNNKLGSASTATISNNTGALTEKWALSSNAQTINDNNGSGVWTLATSSTAVGADQVSIQAVFGSSATASASCPAPTATDWNQSFAPLLTSTPVTYTHATFADSNLNNGGNGSLLLYNPDVAAGGPDGRMFAGSQRALCWRLITPSSTSTVDPQNVQIVITAVVP